MENNNNTFHNVTIALVSLIIFCYLVLFVVLLDLAPHSRCKRAFPDDGYKQELCLEYLYKGKTIEDIK
jgi:hypothetical protein